MKRSAGLNVFGLRGVVAAIAATSVAHAAPAAQAALCVGSISCQESFTLQEHRAAHLFEYLPSQRQIVQRAAVRAQQISLAYYACKLHTLVVGYGYRGRCHCEAGIELYGADGMRQVSLDLAGFNLFHPVGNHLYVEAASLREPRPSLDRRLVPGEPGVAALAADAAHISDYTDLITIDLRRATIERVDPLPAVLAMWPAPRGDLYLRLLHEFRTGYMLRYTPRSGHLHPMPETSDAFEPQNSWSPYFSFRLFSGNREVDVDGDLAPWCRAAHGRTFWTPRTVFVRDTKTHRFRPAAHYDFEPQFAGTDAHRVVVLGAGKVLVYEPERDVQLQRAALAPSDRIARAWAPIASGHVVLWGTPREDDVTEDSSAELIVYSRDFSRVLARRQLPATDLPALSSALVPVAAAPRFPLAKRRRHAATHQLHPATEPARGTSSQSSSVPAPRGRP